MAKFEIKFIDEKNDFAYIECFENNCNQIEIRIVCNEPECENQSTILLDKSTAIKFAKTLRTEINKITESEVNNG
jgi:hypothetical protein